MNTKAQFVPQRRYDYYEDIANSDQTIYNNVMNEWKRIMMKRRFIDLENNKREELKNKFSSLKTDDGNTNTLYDSIKTELDAEKDKDAELITKLFSGGSIDKHRFDQVFDSITKNIEKHLKERKTFRDKITKDFNKLIDPIGQQGGNFVVPEEKYRKRTLDELNADFIRINNNQYLVDAGISSIDILVFIIVTYVIQQIAMIFIKWAIDIEYVQTFEKALALYIMIYLIIFLMILGLVNIDYGYSDIFNVIPSYLYYFFVRTNGYMRVMIHIAFMLLMTIIPIIIKTNKGELLLSKFIMLDLKSKRDLYTMISKFSLGIWFITSIMAATVQ